MPPKPLMLPDIKLPPSPIHWLPPLGYFILAAIVILIGLVIFYGIQYYRNKHLPRKQALQLLGSIKQDYRLHHDAALAVQQCSILLKRYAISCFPNLDCAGAHAMHWVGVLSTNFPNAKLSEPVAQLLAHGPYQHKIEQNIEDLFAYCNNLLVLHKKVLKR